MFAAERPGPFPGPSGGRVVVVSRRRGAKPRDTEIEHWDALEHRIGVLWLDEDGYAVASWPLPPQNHGLPGRWARGTDAKWDVRGTVLTYQLDEDINLVELTKGMK